MEIIINIKFLIKSKYIARYCLLFSLAILIACTNSKQSKELEVQFSAGYGQLEVGGQYAGVEFHKSRPLPSRISFYYPVANSLDISTDYWKRYESLPINFILKSGNQTDSLGKIPYDYTYTPYQTKFKKIESDLEFNFSYNFCEDLPLIVLKINIKNVSNKAKDVDLQSHLDPTIRTSHTYSTIKPTDLWYNDDFSIAKASFVEKAADSSLLFIVNSGYKSNKTKKDIQKDKLAFEYQKQLVPNEEFEIIQLIGMCRIKEQDSIINEAKLNWQTSAENYEKRVLNYSFEQSYFNVEDNALQQTMHWSKAIIASNAHYINDNFVPMPCPAEYNFFFTHDLLLTSLGAVYFDLEYVKDGLQYLQTLSQSDSILAHAYYWKDDKFITEYCNSDNWNNLWLIIVSSSYLKHSADLETTEKLYPIIKKSLHMMLRNKNEDDIMYAKRPDWWDAGDVYGARAYISILMYKALRDYVYVADKLQHDSQSLAGYLQLAERMKKKLIEKFWDDKTGYLLNMIDDKTVDYHYYMGSILAAHFNLLDSSKMERLLQTVQTDLLDENIGVRNAMPADFHKLIPVYKLNGNEAGDPYYYFNGGVWPHGNVWYTLGLLANNQAEKAKTVFKKYLTLEGIQNSPNGQPAFYEYRITDIKSSRYGEVDKPSFLWAGGLFLYTLYQMAGVKEDFSNIYFNPDLPSGFENCEYDLIVFGKQCRIKWAGNGSYFKKILIDGKEQHSAVILGPTQNIFLERGIPETPYLAKANCAIESVQYDWASKKLSVKFENAYNPKPTMRIISPSNLIRQNTAVISTKKVENIYIYELSLNEDNYIDLYFE